MSIMNENENEAFEVLLAHRRGVPAMDKTLPERIINAAIALPEQHNILTKTQSIVNEISMMLVLPKPAYAMPLCLIIGAVSALAIDGGLFAGSGEVDVLTNEVWVLDQDWEL